MPIMGLWFIAAAYNHAIFDFTRSILTGDFIDFAVLTGGLPNLGTGFAAIFDGPSPAVPVPTSLALFGVGLLGVAGSRRR